MPNSNNNETINRTLEFLYQLDGIKTNNFKQNPIEAEIPKQLKQKILEESHSANNVQRSSDNVVSTISDPYTNRMQELKIEQQKTELARCKEDLEAAKNKNTNFKWYIGIKIAFTVALAVVVYFEFNFILKFLSNPLNLALFDSQGLTIILGLFIIQTFCIIKVMANHLYPNDKESESSGIKDFLSFFSPK